MTIVATCACGARFSAPPELAGQSTTCPTCGFAMRIPAATSPQSPAPATSHPAPLAPAAPHPPSSSPAPARPTAPSNAVSSSMLEGTYSSAYKKPKQRRLTAAEKRMMVLGGLGLASVLALGGIGFAIFNAVKAAGDLAVLSANDTGQDGAGAGEPTETNATDAGTTSDRNSDYMDESVNNVGDDDTMTSTNGNVGSSGETRDDDANTTGPLMEYRWPTTGYLSYDFVAETPQSNPATVTTGTIQYHPESNGDSGGRGVAREMLVYSEYKWERSGGGGTSRSSSKKKMSVDSAGRVGSFDGTLQAPFFLGQLGRLAIVEFPSDGRKSWTTTEHVQVRFRNWSGGSSRRRTPPPRSSYVDPPPVSATRTTTYTITGRSGDLLLVDKSVEVRGDSSDLYSVANGTIEFDVANGRLDSAAFKGRFEISSERGYTRSPFTLTYRLDRNAKPLTAASRYSRPTNPNTGNLAGGRASPNGAGAMASGPTVTTAPAAPRLTEKTNLFNLYKASNVNRGRPTFNGLELITDKVGATQVYFPARMPAKYTFSADVTRIDRKGALIMGIVMNDQHVCNVVLGLGETTTQMRSGLSAVSGNDLQSSSNPTVYEGNVFRTNVKTTVQCVVDRTELRVYVGNRRIIDFDDDASSLSVTTFMIPKQGYLSIGTWDGRFRIRNVVVEPQ